MKSIISAVAFASLFTIAACNNSSSIKEKDAAIQAQQHTIDSMNAELAKKHVVDSMNEAIRTQYVIPQSVVLTPEAEKTPIAIAPKVKRHRSVTRSHATSSNNTTAVAQAPSSQETAPTHKKKGWSAKAKGAVIGAGVGAATGAIVNGRNRAAGAVIGTVIGAAAGTGTGAVIDKKKGR